MRLYLVQKKCAIRNKKYTIATVKSSRYTLLFEKFLLVKIYEHLEFRVQNLFQLSLFNAVCIYVFHHQEML
uniref:Uncharacterized protein n=1 Tax=Octopus bimaculoides TaxID=37653 RepID=A0A0L8GS70_OCTBM